MARPNILFLMSDEHRADFTGYEGHPVVRTPFLDRLAADGVVFRNAYAPSPICVPGRQCMMSGRLPRTCRCERYGHDLAPGTLTFAGQLARYGYNTVCSGKLHHMGTDQMMGWTMRPYGDLHVHTPFIAERNEDAFEALRAARPPDTGKWSDAKEIKRAGVGRGPCEMRDRLATQVAQETVVQYFSEPYYDRVSGHEPLLLKLSLVSPHYPYFTEEERFTYYLNRVTPFLETEAFDHPFLSQRRVIPGVDASERELSRATAAYCGMIERLDEQFAALAETLAHVGQDLDDWIVIYTSDHGEMLGEHGIWEKQKFFEASARVPLIIRWPRRFAARTVCENVNQCDLFATLCDLCGVPVPPGLDSRSLVPLMSGDSSGWCDETVSQFGHRNLMIKRGDLKYQYYGPEMPEVLFDLAADPGERRNAIGDARHEDAVVGFRRRLAELGHGPEADPEYVNAGYCSDN